MITELLVSLYYVLGWRISTETGCAGLDVWRAEENTTISTAIYTVTTISNSLHQANTIAKKRQTNNKIIIPIIYYGVYQYTTEYINKRNVWLSVVRPLCIVHAGLFFKVTTNFFFLPRKLKNELARNSRNCNNREAGNWCGYLTESSQTHSEKTRLDFLSSRGKN